MNTAQRPLWQFGVFQANLATGELRQNGRTIKLQPQPFKVLALLLERHGELVMREEIRQELWGGDTFVDFEQGLNFAIKKIREALGDDANHPRYIETLPRRGYRFIAPIEPTPAIPAPLGESAPKTTILQNRVISISGGLMEPHLTIRGDSGHSAIAAEAAPESVDISMSPAEQRAPIPVDVAVAKAGTPHTWRLVAVGALVALVIGLAVALLRPHRGGPPPELAERQLTASPPEDYVTGAAISPDGKYLAYHDQTGLYLRSTDSGETHAVALPLRLRGGIFDLCWFPGGGKLLADVREPDGVDVWMIPIMGVGEPQLLYQHAYQPAISPDGRMIAFANFEYGGNEEREVWVGGINGEMPRKLVDGGQAGTVFSAAWSPDGRWITYIRRFQTPQGSWTTAIEARPVAGGPAKTLVADSNLPKWNSIGLQGHAAAEIWSPDSRLLFPVGDFESSPAKFSLWSVRVKLGTGESVGKPVRLTQWNETSPTSLAVTADGKHLSFIRMRVWPDVYLGDLSPDGARMKMPRRLTLDNRGSNLAGWTHDGQAILFVSYPNGRPEIFKQGLNENVAEKVIAGPGDAYAVAMSPDGYWYLYAEGESTRAADGTTSHADWLMRRPVAGGPPERVLEWPRTAPFYYFDCSQNPKANSPCVLALGEGKDLVFYSLDPVRGKGKWLGKIQVTGRYMSWSLSPDGSRVALVDQDSYGGKIEVLMLSDATWKEVSVNPGGQHLQSITWAADEKGFFVTSIELDSFDLLHVTLAGKAQPLMASSLKQWLENPAPSPDGKYLAFSAQSFDSNAWMIDNH